MSILSKIKKEITCRQEGLFLIFPHHQIYPNGLRLNGTCTSDRLFQLKVYTTNFVGNIQSKNKCNYLSIDDSKFIFFKKKNHLGKVIESKELAFSRKKLLLTKSQSSCPYCKISCHIFLWT